MDSFLTEAVSAAPPAEWDVTCRCESARVLTAVILKLFQCLVSHATKSKKN